MLCPIGRTQSGRNVVLAADTLTIDTDQMTLSVVWRASFDVPEEGATWRIYAGIEAAEHPLTQAPTRATPEETLDADPAEEAPQTVTPFRRGLSPPEVEGMGCEPPPHTLDFSDDVPFSTRSVLPFAQGAPASIRRPNPVLPPATPFDRSPWGEPADAVVESLSGSIGTGVFELNLPQKEAETNAGADAFVMGRALALEPGEEEELPLVAPEVEGAMSTEETSPVEEDGLGPLGAFFLTAIGKVGGSRRGAFGR